MCGPEICRVLNAGSTLNIIEYSAGCVCVRKKPVIQVRGSGKSLDSTFCKQPLAVVIWWRYVGVGPSPAAGCLGNAVFQGARMGGGKDREWSQHQSAAWDCGYWFIHIVT